MNVVATCKYTSLSTNKAIIRMFNFKAQTLCEENCSKQLICYNKNKPDKIRYVGNALCSRNIKLDIKRQMDVSCNWSAT